MNAEIKNRWPDDLSASGDRSLGVRKGGAASESEPEGGYKGWDREGECVSGPRTPK